MKTLPTFELIKELVQPILTSTVYQIDESYSEHSVMHPPLLDQLLATMRVATAESKGSRATPGSQSPIRIDAFDAYRTIHKEAKAVLSLEFKVKPSSDVKKNVARFLDLPISKDLAQLIYQWHATASVITDWQTPPFSPNAPCPVCNKNGTLRIKLAMQSAVCVSCKSLWNSATIGLLADHIRECKRDTPQDVVQTSVDDA
jgi:hypothetical protein